MNESLDAAAPVGAPGNPWLFNPGSVSIPKDGTHSYGLYESGLPLEQAFSRVVLPEG